MTRSKSCQGEGGRVVQMDGSEGRQVQRPWARSQGVETRLCDTSVMSREVVWDEDSEVGRGKLTQNLLLVAQLCMTQLCNPMNCSSPGSSVHGIPQAGILEWVSISLSIGPSWPRDWTWVYLYCRQLLYWLSHQGSLLGHRFYFGGNGNPLQYSCLENSMDGGAW